MALKPDSQQKAQEDNSLKNKLGIRVQGDLGDLKIIEASEASDSEHSDDEETVDKHHTSGPLQILPDLPNNLIKTGQAPVLSNFAITNSENVQFGNNTYFHGPVVIKQVINKRGVENASYTPTEPERENIPNPPQPSPDKTKIDVKSVKNINIPTWFKLAITIATILVLGLLCALGLYIQNHSQEENASNSNSDTPVKDTTDPLLISPNHLKIVSRTDWLAQPVEKELRKIKHPVPWVVITHTATEGCTYQSQCVLRVRLIQMFHIESKEWDDIGYNFLVAGDGSAYFGRGWDYIGSHTLGYNTYSIGIGFVGTFNNEAPPQKQLEACQKLIKLGVQQGKIAKDYKLLAHRQLQSTLSPGDKLYDIIKTWPHFVKEGTPIEEVIPKGY